LIISTPRDLPLIENMLGDGSRFGVKFSYLVQPKPEGIAQAFILGADFVGKDSVCLILGDNIFYGTELAKLLEKSSELRNGSEIYAYRVNDPERYGVIELNNLGNPISIEEKPANPKSNWAITGLYFYDNSVLERAKSLQPSARGELEITDINNAYLKENSMHVRKFGRGIAWLDTGTFESLLSSSTFVQTIEQRTGLMVGCPEEIAYAKGWISKKVLYSAAEQFGKNEYGRYLKKIADEQK
jgi:glucose-1-phosphate thymidylyltransferase